MKVRPAIMQLSQYSNKCKYDSRSTKRTAFSNIYHLISTSSSTTCLGLTLFRVFISELYTRTRTCARRATLNLLIFWQLLGYISKQKNQVDKQ